MKGEETRGEWWALPVHYKKSLLRISKWEKRTVGEDERRAHHLFISQ